VTGRGQSEKANLDKGGKKKVKKLRKGIGKSEKLKARQGREGGSRSGEREK